jgi:hypothetical protein
MFCVRALCTWLSCALLLCGGPVRAQEPQVRTSLQSSEPLWVGQATTLVVEILVPGYFASAAHFNLPDPAGVILLPPQDHPIVSNETEGDTVFSVQRHELHAWPMRAGEPVIPSFSIGISFKRNPLDAEGQPFTLSTEAIPLMVELPPGAENLGTVISARNLKVTENWQPEPGADPVVAGTTFTRSITFNAPDVPGMLFPVFPAEPIDGLGVYAKQQLQDRSERGDFIGQRRDEVTYICQHPGQFTVPAAQFTWFDLDSQQLRTETFPLQTFDVIVNPAMASPEAGSTSAALPRTESVSKIVLVFVMLGLLLVAGFRNHMRRLVVRVLAPFRPVHLQALNPPG